MNVKPAYMVIPEWLVGIIGLFVPIMKELKEMLYQYDRDYFLNSSKFNKAFNYTPVSAEDAVKMILETLN